MNVKRWFLCGWCVWMLAILAAGCGTQTIYGNSTGGAGTVPPKQQWTATGSVQSPSQAIDASLQTAAIGTQEGQFLLIDLQKPATFQTVVTDHGRQDGGHALEVELSVSLDGRQFQTVYVAVGTRRVTLISLPQPVLARYVRLRALQLGPQDWSLAEVYLQ